MGIKKAFVPIVEFLEANAGKKVSTIMDEVRQLCSAKTGGASGGNTCIRDADNNVLAIYCYYHKKWEPVVGDNAVEYGAKASSSTGLNSMCKEGTSAWTKQQLEAKKANAALLTDVASGKVKPEEIVNLQADIDTKRKEISPRGDGIGWDEAKDVVYENA